MTTRFLAAVLFTICTFAGAIVAAAQPAATQKPPPPQFEDDCQTCHETSQGAVPSTGPNLFGVGGRKAGTAEGFDYSEAMRNASIVWSAETIAGFVTDPQKAVPNNKMDHSGVDPETAQEIAEYLMTLKP